MDMRTVRMDAERKMTDVDEESRETHTKKILDLDSPLENHIITTKDDVTYINMDPVPLSMLEVIDGSDTSVAASLQQKTGNSNVCDEERVMLVKVAPDPMSMLEVSDSTDTVGGHSSCRVINPLEEDAGVLQIGSWSSSQMNFISGSQIYTCPLCGEFYSSHDELKEHLSVHSLESPFASKYFNTTLHDGNGYIQAIKNTSGAEEQSEHTCSVCSRSFPQLSSLKKHMKMHSGKKPVNCTECGKTYSEISYLKKHILTHVGSNQNNFCSICNSKFNDIISLRQHMHMHAASIKPHSCVICGKLYTRLAVLKRHVMLHFNSSKFSKVIEGNDIPDDENGDINDDDDEDDNIDEENERLKIKFKPQKPPPIKRHVCTTCSKAFNSLGNLQRHHRIHTGEKPYVCSICSSSFSQLSHLRQHHQTHTDEKLECPICSVCISNDRNFKRHMKLHTGERPFKCEVCSATFTQQTHLKKHSRTHNNTVYTCSNCNLTLPDLNEYKEHMRKHAGERPYACSICDTSYSDINVLKEHVETHSRTPSSTSTPDSFNSVSNHKEENCNTTVDSGGKIKTMKDCSVQASPMDNDSMTSVEHVDSCVSDNENLMLCDNVNDSIKQENSDNTINVKNSSTECESVGSCRLNNQLGLKAELVL